MQEVANLAAASRSFGTKGGYVFLGGGNTSFKNDEFLFIKPSGTTLATIREDQFVKVRRESLRKVFTADVPSNPWEREATVKDIMAAAVEPAGSGRASVEAPVHEVIEYAYVIHLHPTLVNGMTCARNGAKTAAKLFPEALWIEYTDPGYTLSTVVKQRLDAAKAERGAQPKVFFLGNHGVFVGADTLAEIEDIYTNLIGTLEAAYAEAGVVTELVTNPADPATFQAEAPALRSLLAENGQRAIVAVEDAFAVAPGPLSPDHIVYAKSFSYAGDFTADAIAAFNGERGYLPKVLATPGKAVYCTGPTLKDARAAAVAAKDAAQVLQLTAAFGGPRFLADEEWGFIENWEVESYRRKIASAGAGSVRLANRVCVVTGAAQGFGLGIAEELAGNGAHIVVADLNVDGAQATADELNARFGADRAIAVAVNISNEESVAAMATEVVRTFGGLDVFVANAGVLKAGSVKEMTLKDWEFVTSVNYTGYFLCTKYIAPVLAAQTAAGGDWCDIVQINSKSGLEGSNKNGAYAGSKFGTIGLTQSFAKELVTDHVKVNSICPGNYFDGPLWSHPERGLFVQYLQTGKVPGAKTIEDVRRFYEEKVPMARGCTPEDVAKAIMYCVEQKYETGQAIPVTGGQVMLS
jgi:NAD(P)-dependent dehydrogenase (short-subunit alcohol dehydrogenase family)/rhamnose utilization protein RhaD (predicted bifunctional aldolase and dehydrogenase)